MLSSALRRRKINHVENSALWNSYGVRQSSKCQKEIFSSLLRLEMLSGPIRSDLPILWIINGSTEACIYPFSVTRAIKWMAMRASDHHQIWPHLINYFLHFAQLSSHHYATTRMQLILYYRASLLAAFKKNWLCVARFW